MVPSVLSTREEKDAKSSPNVIAYVSVESRNTQDNRPKPLFGQIRKCNLTNFHSVSNLILREVIFLKNECLLYERLSCEKLNLNETVKLYFIFCYSVTL